MLFPSYFLLLSALMWWLVPLCLMTIVVVVLLRSDKSKKASVIDLINYNRVEGLKKSGRKVAVKLEKCFVISNNYTTEENVRNNQYDSVYGAFFSPDLLIKRNPVYQSVVVFEEEREGHTIRFVSSPIYKDADAIRFLLLHHKSREAYIYFDKGSEYYYFDLEFLFGKPQKGKVRKVMHTHPASEKPKT